MRLVGGARVRNLEMELVYKNEHFNLHVEVVKSRSYTVPQFGGGGWLRKEHTSAYLGGPKLKQFATSQTALHHTRGLKTNGYTS